MKIEVDLPILREATIALRDIIQQLPSLKARDSQDQLIVVWKTLHKLCALENENPEPYHCAKCGKETDRIWAHSKVPSGFEALCQECAGTEGWLVK